MNKENISAPLIVAVPFRYHATHIHSEARKLLTDADFTLICNKTGRTHSREEQKAK